MDIICCRRSNNSRLFLLVLALLFSLSFCITFFSAPYSLLYNFSCNVPQYFWFTKFTVELMWKKFALNNSMNTCYSAIQWPSLASWAAIKNAFVTFLFEISYCYVCFMSSTVSSEINQNWFVNLGLYWSFLKFGIISASVFICFQFKIDAISNRKRRFNEWLCSFHSFF